MRSRTDTELFLDSGVTRTSVLPEPPGTPSSRGHQELWVPGVTQNFSGPRSPRNTSGIPESPGNVPGNRNLGEIFRDPRITGKPGFPDSRGTLQRSRRHPELLRYPGDIRMCSGIQESPGTVPGFRSHSETRVPRVNGNSGFQESPGTPDSRVHTELRVPKSPGIFRVPVVTRRTTGFRSHT